MKARPAAMAVPTNIIKEFMSADRIPHDDVLELELEVEVEVELLDLDVVVFLVELVPVAAAEPPVATAAIASCEQVLAAAGEATKVARVKPQADDVEDCCE